MANIAKRSSAKSSGKENKLKGPGCGQCEQKAAHVVSVSLVMLAFFMRGISAELH